MAAAINVAVALLAWVWRRVPEAPAEPRALRTRQAVQRAPGARLVYVAIGFSGLTALGAEVVWTRLLSLLLGATVYTFSIILAVFLTGLWAGSSGRFIPGAPDPSAGIRDWRWPAARSCWPSRSPGPPSRWRMSCPIGQSIRGSRSSPWFNFDLDVTRCLRAILSGTLLWGASFPLALAGAAAEGEDPARSTGEVYAANTAGSIVGALLFRLLLIPAIGTRGSQQVLIWLARRARPWLPVAAGLFMMRNGSGPPWPAGRWPVQPCSRGA